MVKGLANAANRLTRAGATGTMSTSGTPWDLFFAEGRYKLSRSSHRAVLTAVVWLCAFAVYTLVGAVSAQARTVHVFEGSFGSEGTGPGQFKTPRGIAVNDTTHNVYVVDIRNSRVEEFSSTGSFLGEFNGSGSPTGVFSAPTEIAVDNSGKLLDPSAGDVYVVDSRHNVIDKFSASGTYEGQLTGRCEKENESPPCSASTFVPFASISGVAVDPNGGVWVNENGEIDNFSGANPNEYLSERRSQFGSTLGLALDSEGNLYVIPGSVAKLDSSGATLVHPFGANESASGVALDAGGEEAYIDYKTKIGGYDLSGTQREPSFGVGQLATSVRVAVDASDGKVYATETSNRVVIFKAVRLPAVSIGEVTEQQPRSLTLNGTVNPEGQPVTSCAFEYDTAPYATEEEAPHGTSVPCTPSEPGSGSTPVAVSAHVGGLTPQTKYYYRLTAENVAGVPSRTLGHEVVAGPIIGSEYVTAVTSSSATLHAPIDPNGADTHYYFEYGTTASYGTDVPLPPSGADIGSALGGQTESVHVQGLQPGETYHYRLVVEQGGETFEEPAGSEPDNTFTMQAAGGNEFALPDGRAWELVSPAYKGGALIGVLDNPPLNAQAAADGGAIAYNTNEPIGEGVEGRGGSAEILSRHGTGGWGSRDISASHSFPPEGEYEKATVGSEHFYLFSPDLLHAAFEPRGPFTPQVEGVSERTDFLRDNAHESYLPLVTQTNVQPAGTEIAGDPTSASDQMSLEAVTLDLRHVILHSKIALTSDAGPTGSATNDLYEWSSGELRFIGEGRVGNAGDVFGAGMTEHAISNYGRWVVIRQSGEPGQTNLRYVVRDTVSQTSIPFGGATPYFQTMSTDGSKVFYLEAGAGTSFQEREQGELYVFDPVTKAATELTSNHLEGETSAGVQNTVVASEDGNYVYFVATGVLAPGAKRGSDNLYVLHDEAGQWATTYIATLSSEDRPDWRPGSDGQNTHTFDLRKLDTRVSPDGRYVTFMSDRSLTGYDNIDAVSGKPDEEVYVYDAVSGRLACASCNPTGARPAGAFDTGSTGFASGLLIDSSRAWEPENEQIAPVDSWVAGVLPAAWSHQTTVSSFAFGTYQPRYLFDSGRLFFESTDALVPQDTNGVADVYEYEPVGIGSCTSASATFNERSGGCVDLISSGRSPSESAFADASGSGEDAFFVTNSKLVGEDGDTAYDLYDAHVCGTGWSCQVAPVLPPPCTSGDSCKGAPSPQPELFGTAPSETFNGVGNIVDNPRQIPPKAKRCAKGKVRRHGRCVKKARNNGKRRRARKSATVKATGRGK